MTKRVGCDKKGCGRLAASALARATQVLLLQELVASPKLIMSSIEGEEGLGTRLVSSSSGP